VLQSLIHYSYNDGLKFFSFDFFFKFPGTFVDAPSMICELHYIFELYTICTIL